MRARLLAALLTASVLVTPSVAGASSADAPATDAVVASYDGRTIDLSVSWEGAGACAIGATNVCFGTEAEMDAAFGWASTSDDLTLATAARSGASPQVDCTPKVTLYANTSFGGTALVLTARFTFLNLSSYSFDNVTSSYKIGGCSSTFYDGASGGGSVYPGPTSAFATTTAMLAGWDNRISSIYIS